MSRCWGKFTSKGLPKECNGEECIRCREVPPVKVKRGRGQRKSRRRKNGKVQGYSQMWGYSPLRALLPTAQALVAYFG